MNGEKTAIANAIEAMSVPVPDEAVVEPEPAGAAFYRREGAFEAYVEHSRAKPKPERIEGKPGGWADKVEWLTRG